MTVGVSDLREYVGASVSDDTFLATCLGQAVELIEIYAGDQLIPDSILDGCYLTVGSEIYQRRNAPSGITNFASPDGSAIRLARDPLTSVYPILDRFVIGGL